MDLLGLWLVCGCVFAEFMVGLGSQWLLCGDVVERDR